MSPPMPSPVELLFVFVAVSLITVPFFLVLRAAVSRARWQRIKTTMEIADSLEKCGYAVTAAELREKAQREARALISRRKTWL